MGLDQSLMRKVNNGKDVEEIYWRKANFVHKFFFDRAFDEDDYVFGEDNCVPMPANIYVLEELLSLCKEVMADKKEAPYLLPTMSGFFFGSTEYNDWYWDDVQYTIDNLEALLKRATEDDEFYYYAWY